MEIADRPTDRTVVCGYYRSVGSVARPSFYRRDCERLLSSTTLSSRLTLRQTFSGEVSVQGVQAWSFRDVLQSAQHKPLCQQHTFTRNCFMTNQMRKLCYEYVYGSVHRESVSCNCPTRCDYTKCNRRNGPDFGRVFLRSNYTDITQNTYIQS